MEAFSAVLALCAGSSPATDELPAKMPVTRSFDVLFDLVEKRIETLEIWDVIVLIMTPS